MKKLQKIEYIKEQVSDYIDLNLDKLLSDPNDEALAHIKAIAASIIIDDLDILRGGGFVQAFNSNDLLLTISHADRIIKNAIPLLILTKYNVDLSKLN